MNKLSLIVTLIIFVGFPMSHLPAEEAPKWGLRYEAKMEPNLGEAVEMLDGTKESFQKPAKENYDVAVGEEGLDFFFRGAGVFALEPKGGQIDFEHNTLDFRLRLENTDNRIEPPVKNASAVCIQIGESRTDNPGMYVVGFYTDPEEGTNFVILEGRESTAPFPIGSEFHDYRVVAGKNSIELHVDGEIVGEVRPRLGVSLPGIRIGNARGSDHTGQATLGYLRMDFDQALDPKKD